MSVKRILVSCNSFANARLFKRGASGMFSLIQNVKPGTATRVSSINQKRPPGEYLTCDKVSPIAFSMDYTRMRNVCHTEVNAALKVVLKIVSTLQICQRIRKHQPMRMCVYVHTYVWTNSEGSAVTVAILNIRIVHQVYYLAEQERDKEWSVCVCVCVCVCARARVCVCV